jgi:hypothetical protein
MNVEITYKVIFFYEWRNMIKKPCIGAKRFTVWVEDFDMTLE